MDFNDFDPTLAITKMEQINEMDGTNQRPFVDENPCLLCGHKAFANFIDLTLPTSCTSQSSTPVKRKLRDILKRLWVPSRDNKDNILCLACYDMIDRYDSLEAQLNNIRENIEEKYNKTCLKKNVKVKNTKKRGRAKAGGRGKRIKNSYILLPDMLSEEDRDGHSEIENDNGMTEGRDSDYSEQEITTVSVTDIQDDGRINHTMQAMPVEVIEEEPNMNVYDENHQTLQRGQKMRLGCLMKDENNMEAYKCGYCQQIWGDIAQLHSHVYSFHQPEVVDVAIPIELGLGNTMNCGIEVQNCCEPLDCPKPWACIYCDAVFRARTNMSSHFKDKHTPHKPFLCLDCGESFRKGIDLNRHKLYFCPERTPTFAPKRKYKKRDLRDKRKSNKHDIDSD